MKRALVVLIVLGVFVGLFLLVGPFYIVEEGEQVIVIRFGQIVSEEQDAGLKFKIPFVDNVVRYSKKILSWDGDPRRVPTAENQFIWVDTTARWRIANPSRFYSSVTTMEQAYSRLDDIIESAVRTVIAANGIVEAVRNSNIINTIDRAAPLDGALSDESAGLAEIQNLLTIVDAQPEIAKGRRMLSQEMFEDVSETTPRFGIELIDIVIRQIRYSDDLTESVYNRMVSERQQIAQAYRSFGEGRKQELLGQLENDKRAILSRAYEEAEGIRGLADAEAASIYSEAYSQNAEFFEFWRALESYKKVIPSLDKVITTDMEYFDYLYDKDGN